VDFSSKRIIFCWDWIHLARVMYSMLFVVLFFTTKEVRERTYSTG